MTKADKTAYVATNVEIWMCATCLEHTPFSWNAPDCCAHCNRQFDAEMAARLHSNLLAAGWSFRPALHGDFMQPIKSAGANGEPD